MAITVDELITRFVLDDSDYDRGTKNVQSNTSRMMSDVNKGFDSFYDKLKLGFEVASKFTGVMVGVAGAILAASYAAAQKAADFEALELSLAAIEGSGKKAKKAMQDLFEIAKMPGLGREEAVSGYRGLRLAGASEDFAKEVVRQFGNANALAGGGKNELDRVLLAVKQMLSKQFLQGDEILQLSEAGIPVTQLLKNKFGTADTEQLKKSGIESALVVEALTQALAEMPRVTGGAKNSLENFYDSLDSAQIAFGKGIISAAFGTFDQVSDALMNLVDGGEFQLLGETIGEQIMSGLGIVTSGDLEADFINLGGALVTAAAATRNFFTQLQNLWETVVWDKFKFVDTLGIGELIYRKVKQQALGNDGLDPSSEGKRYVDAAMQQKRLFDQQKADREADRKKEEEARQSRLSMDRTSLEDRLQEARAKINAPGETKQEGHLRQIAQNTRELVDFQRYAIGGGGLGDIGISAREVSDMKHGKATGPKGLIEQGVSLIYLAMMQANSRTSGFISTRYQG